MLESTTRESSRVAVRYSFGQRRHGPDEGFAIDAGTSTAWEAASVVVQTLGPATPMRQAMCGELRVHLLYDEKVISELPSRVGCRRLPNTDFTLCADVFVMRPHFCGASGVLLHTSARILLQFVEGGEGESYRRTAVNDERTTRQGGGRLLRRLKPALRAANCG